MSDLEDLNRTLYDMGAQDLLDVWDAMETEVSDDAFSQDKTLQFFLIYFEIAFISLVIILPPI